MLIEEIVYELIEADDPYKILEIWSKYNGILKSYKLIINIKKHRNIFPPELLNHLVSEDTDFISYFPSGNILFVDNENIEEMIKNDTVDIGWDYSIMLDTNYTSYIEDFMNEKMNYNLESVYKTLDALLSGKFNYDYTFYLLENYSNFFDSGKKKYSNKHEGHIALYNNLFNVKLFGSIDSDEYKKNKKLLLGLNEAEAHIATSKLINELLVDNSLFELLLDTHKAMTLFLIGVWQIQFESKASAKNKIKKLMNYVTEKVGIYFEREFMIAFKYFEKNNSVGMLNKINKGGKQTDLLNKIENIAWDFMIPRVMEVYMAGHKLNYFLPFTLSHDKKLKELIKHFEIKGFLFNKEDMEFYPISSVNTTTFFVDKGLRIEEIYEFGSAETLTKRRATIELNKKNDFLNIQIELNKLELILKS